MACGGRARQVRDLEVATDRREADRQRVDGAASRARGVHPLPVVDRQPDAGLAVGHLGVALRRARRGAGELDVHGVGLERVREAELRASANRSARDSLHLDGVRVKQRLEPEQLPVLAGQQVDVGRLHLERVVAHAERGAGVERPFGDGRRAGRGRHPLRLIAEKVALEDGGGLDRVRLRSLQLDPEARVARAEGRAPVLGAVDRRRVRRARARSRRVQDDGVAGQVVEALGRIEDPVGLDESVDRRGELAHHVHQRRRRGAGMGERRERDRRRRRCGRRRRRRGLGRDHDLRRERRRWWWYGSSRRCCLRRRRGRRCGRRRRLRDRQSRETGECERDCAGSNGG